MCAGRPEPKIRWWRGETLIDTGNEGVPGHMSPNKQNQLIIEALSRYDQGAVYTCQASNSNLSAPVSSSVTIEMFRKSHLLPVPGSRRGETLPVSGAPRGGNHMAKVHAGLPFPPLHHPPTSPTTPITPKYNVKSRTFCRSDALPYFFGQTRTVKEGFSSRDDVSTSLLEKTKISDRVPKRTIGVDTVSPGERKSSPRVRLIRCTRKYVSITQYVRLY